MIQTNILSGPYCPFKTRPTYFVYGYTLTKNIMCCDLPKSGLFQLVINWFLVSTTALYFDYLISSCLFTLSFLCKLIRGRHSDVLRHFFKLVFTIFYRKCIVVITRSRLNSFYSFDSIIWSPIRPKIFTTISFRLIYPAISNA